MFVFIVLLGVFAALHLPVALGLRWEYVRSRQAKARVALGVTFAMTASSHFLAPETLLQMVPSFLPLRLEAIYISGIAELAGAVGLLVPRLQRIAGLGLVALLVAVFPANVNVAINNLQIDGYPGSPIYQWVRLPLQLLLIGVTLWASRSKTGVFTGGPVRVERSAWVP